MLLIQSLQYSFDFTQQNDENLGFNNRIIYEMYFNRKYKRYLNEVQMF